MAGWMRQRQVTGGTSSALYDRGRSRPFAIAAIRPALLLRCTFGTPAAPVNSLGRALQVRYASG